MSAEEKRLLRGAKPNKRKPKVSEVFLLISIELFENGYKWEKEIHHAKLGADVTTKVNWVKVKAPKAWKKALPLTQIKSLTLPKAKTMLRSIEEKKAWFDH